MSPVPLVLSHFNEPFATKDRNKIVIQNQSFYMAVILPLLVQILPSLCHSFDSVGREIRHCDDFFITLLDRILSGYHLFVEKAKFALSGWDLTVQFGWGNGEKSFGHLLCVLSCK